MAGPPTADYGTIIIEWQGANQAYPGACTFGVEAAAVTESSLFDLGAALVDLFEVCWDSSTTDIRASLKIGPEASGPTYLIGEGYAGGRTGAPAAPNVALLVSKTILNKSGRFWGRAFLPAPLETEVADRGLLTSGAFLNYSAALGTFQGALEVLGFAPQVFHENSSDPDPVSTLLVQSTVATQRRRMRR